MYFPKHILTYEYITIATVQLENFKHNCVNFRTHGIL